MLAEAGVERAAEELAAMDADDGDQAFAPPPLLAEYARGGLSPLGHEAG